MHNLGINHPPFAIEAHNVGVGGTTRKVSMQFSPEKRGLTSMYSRPVESSPATNVRAFDANLIAATQIVEQVRSRFPDRDIVMKIDCEGAEYEIIDALIADGGIASITLLMVEWHRFTKDHDPDRLASALAKVQFSTTLHGNPHGMAGMLYAMQTRRSPTAIQPKPERLLSGAHECGVSVAPCSCGVSSELT
jgi:FkbM family methyltransferase